MVGIISYQHTVNWGVVTIAYGTGECLVGYGFKTKDDVKMATVQFNKKR